jgi:fucose permease
LSLAGQAPSRRLTYAGYFGFILIGWNAVLIPSLIRSVEHDLRQTDATFALFYFISALVYAGGALSGGFLTERLGRRVVLVSSGVVLGLGLAGEGLAQTWVLLILAAVPVNWSAGAIDGGTNGLFLDLFRDARGSALSLLHVFFSVGAFTAPFVAGILLSNGMAWRNLLLYTGVFAVPLVIVLLTTAMPSGRHEAGDTPAIEEGKPSPAGGSRIPFIALGASIGLYVAAEVGTSNWLVRFLADEPIATATGVLSIFWGGLALGRLLSNRIADRFDYFAFTVGCIILSSLALASALMVSWLPLVAALFGVAGLFSGPVFPMIVALGGNIYPHRLSALSGGLAASAVAGGLIYPPLIGVMAGVIGIRGGLFGAALLGIPQALGIMMARKTADRAHIVVPG